MPTIILGIIFLWAIGFGFGDFLTSRLSNFLIVIALILLMLDVVIDGHGRDIE